MRLLVCLISAEAFFCWARAAEPTKPEEVVKAEAAFRDGRADEAFKLLREAVKKHPQLPPARLMLARLYFAAGQSAAGRANLEQAAAEAFTHPEVYLANASQALAEGRITDTILNCQTAISLSNTDRWTAEQKSRFLREAHAGLAAAFEARKDWEATRVQLLAWLEIEPKNGVARQRLARALLMLGRDTEALAELQHACQDDAKLEAPEIAIGRLWAIKGDAKRAEEWFQKAVQKYAKDARAHRAFGGWLLDRGRVDAAKIHIDTAAQLEPKSRDSLGLKGLLRAIPGTIKPRSRFLMTSSARSRAISWPTTTWRWPASKSPSSEAGRCNWPK